MSEYRLFKVIRTEGQKYFDIEYVRDVVMCKDCKHWSKYRTDGNQSYCEIHCGYCDGDKYCAWGERAEQTEPQTERSE